MRLKQVTMKNFRCFENATVSFAPGYTVLIGNNGSGKSAALDAVSLALGSFLNGMDGIKSNLIQKDDVRYSMFLQGNTMNREPQYPVVIGAESVLQDGRCLRWERSLNRANGHTTIKAARPIMDFASELQHETRKGNKNVILPLVAYYGTGRLWNTKQRHHIPGKNLWTRIKGYEDCLDAAETDKSMNEWLARMTYLSLQEERPIEELSAVEQALADCYAGIDDSAEKVNIRFSVKINELEIMVQHKDGRIEYLPFHMLSDGIRIILHMVADIAYRMAVLNPQLLDDVIAETDGIVLIDEIDMHLHPAWQKRIIHDLCTIFPKVQFILTTHSPSILVNVPKENIRVLENGKCLFLENKTYGRDINAVLSETMKVRVRPKEIIEKIDAFNKSVDSGNLENAKKILSDLRRVLGENDQDVINAQISLDLEEI